jgi:hypothetical protein
MNRRIVVLVAMAALLAAGGVLVFLWIPRKAAGVERNAPAPQQAVSTVQSGNTLKVERMELTFPRMALADGKYRQDLTLNLLYETEFAARTLPVLKANEGRIRAVLASRLAEWREEDLASYFPPQVKVIPIVNQINDFLRTEEVKTPVVSITVESAVGH